VVAGDGISVEGIGTLENPYEITSESANLTGRVEFTDDGNVDFTATGVGTFNDPLTVFADAVLATSDLTDVPDTEPDEGDVLVWRLGGWEYEQQSGGSGVPPGGTDGQVLTKQSDADGDAAWETVAASGGGSAVVEPLYASSRRHQAATAIPNSTIVTLPLDTEDYTNGIVWNGADFVIPVAGYYQVNASVQLATMSSGGPTLRLVINGSAGVGGLSIYGAASAASSATVNRVVKLAAGDLVHVGVSQVSGAANALNGGAASNWMNITKVPEQPPAGGGVIVERPMSSRRKHAAATSLLNATITAIPFDTEDYTDGIAWSAPDAAFIVPTDGYYNVGAAITFAANATGGRSVYVYLDAVSMAVAGTDATSAGARVATTIKALAGQKISVRAQQSSGSSLALGGGPGYNWVSVTKVPAAYAGSAVSTYGEQNYAASRRQAAAVSCTHATITPVPWDTEDFTDGIAFAGGIFTVPVAGYYQVSAKVGWDSNATGYRRLRILQNGSSAGAGYNFVSPGASTPTNTLSRVLKCAAGDTIQTQIDQNSGSTLGTAAGVANSSIDIVKVPAPVVNGAAASGVWGVGNLAPALVGTDPLKGREIYIDSRGQLRSKPDAADTGWLPVAISPGFAAHATDPPMMRQIGNQVFLRGAWLNTGFAVLTNAYTVGTFPVGIGLPKVSYYLAAGANVGSSIAQFLIGSGTGNTVQWRGGGTALAANYYWSGSYLTD
jgi:hypothetical protein